MGMGCCCCYDYGCITNYGGATQGLRRVRVPSPYKTTMKVKIDKNPFIRRIGNGLAVDYINKKIFGQSSNPLIIHEYNISQYDYTTFKPDKVTLAYTVNTHTTTSGIPGADNNIGGPCCDGKNQRLFYIVNTLENYGLHPAYSATVGSWQFTASIRRVNYDGTGDTEIGTEDWYSTDPPSTQIASEVNYLCYNPATDQLFYTLSTFHLYPLVPGPGFDSNIWYYIKRINADGTGGQTTLITEEGKDHNQDNRFIRSIDIHTIRRKLVYVHRYAPTLLSGIHTTLKIADLDGSNITTLLDFPETQYFFQRATVNYKEDRIYYERSNSTRSFTPVESRSIKFDGTDDKIHFDNLQWDTANLGSGATSVFFGCSKQPTGNKYIGAGHQVS